MTFRSYLILILSLLSLQIFSQVPDKELLQAINNVNVKKVRRLLELEIWDDQVMEAARDKIRQIEQKYSDGLWHYVWQFLYYSGLFKRPTSWCHKQYKILYMVERKKIQMKQNPWPLYKV